MSVLGLFFLFLSLRILNIFILRSFSDCRIFILFERINLSIVDFVGNCGINFLHVYLEVWFESLTSNQSE